MAGDYLQIDHDLPEKAEVLGICERTGLPVDTIMGRLMFLWRLFDRQTTDGFLPHVGPTGLAARCGGDGDFWRAVEAVGWVSFSEDGARIPDFEERFGVSAKRRIREATRKANKRAEDEQGKRTDGGQDPDRLRTQRGQSADTTRTECGQSADTAQTERRRGASPVSVSVSDLDTPTEYLEETPTESLSKSARAASTAGPPDEPDGAAETDASSALELDFVRQWNALPGVRKSQGDRLTEARRRAFRARLKSRQWREDYPKALAKFPLPCTVGDDSWKPDLDWFLRPDSVTRILEGKYDFTKAASRSPPAVARCGPGQRHPADIRDQPGTF